MYNVIFFDLDGTLVDSEPAIVNALKYALKEQFSIIENDDKKLIKIIGTTIKESFMNYIGCNEEEAIKATSKYREYESKNGINETKTYEGIPELLYNLKKDQKFIILATSKPTSVAEKVLEHLKIRKYFDFISGSSIELKRIKKSEIIQHAIDEYRLEDKANMVMIGDTKFDIEAAKEIGIDSIGVKYGVGTQADLKGATFIVDSVNDMDEILRKPFKKYVNTQFYSGLNL